MRDKKGRFCKQEKVKAKYVEKDIRGKTGKEVKGKIVDMYEEYDEWEEFNVESP